MVMFTWRSRGLQRICPALSSESMEFSALNLVSLDRKQTSKQANKPNNKQTKTNQKYFIWLKNIFKLVPGFKENYCKPVPPTALFNILKPITNSVYYISSDAIF